MAQIEEQLENIPGWGLIMDAFNEYAEEHWNNTNPYVDKEGKQRTLGPSSTFEERQAWKRIRNQAWVHDKCFLGLCGVGLDCGFGLVPLAVLLLPVAGPIAMYVVHCRLLTIAHEKIAIPRKLEAKIQGNILLDLLLSLPPVIGAFLSWFHGCLTRNAGMIYVYMDFLAKKRASGDLPTYIGAVPNRQAVTSLLMNPTVQPNLNQETKTTKFFTRKKMEDIEIGPMKQGVL